MLRDKLLYGKNYYAIEHGINKEGEEVFYYLQLVRVRKELEIKTQRSFDSLKNLIVFLKEQGVDSVVIVVNTNQVLAKKGNGEYHEKTTIQATFPNLQLKDFYTEIKNTPTNYFITLSRKQYINNILNEYTKEGIIVLDFALGNLSVFALTSSVKDANFYSSNAKISIESETIQNIYLKEYATETYTINGLQVSNGNILSLGLILRFFVFKQTVHNQAQVEEYKEKKLFNFGYKSALVFFLLLLLVNFMFFNSYYTKVNQINSELSIREKSKRKLAELTNNVNKKKKLLNELRSSSSLSVSKFIDEIVIGVPTTIILEEVNFQPVLGTLKQGKKVKFNTQELNIRGEVVSNLALSTWVDELEQLNWINSVSKLSIQKNKRNKKSKFHILIVTKKNEL